LSARIASQSDPVVLADIEKAEPRPKQIPLSFSQERLWFIDRLQGSIQYHVPSVLRLKGRLNLEAMKSTLREIVNRHEVLRTVFLEEDGSVFQHVINIDDWELVLIDGKEYIDDKEKLEQSLQKLIRTPFDLSRDYMLRAHLVVLGEEDHILVVNLHHIASDGWSKSILVKEVVALYKAFDEGTTIILPPLQIQYADFAIWQRNFLQGKQLEKKLAYWKNKLDGVAQLELPTDFKRPTVQSTKGSRVSFDIDKKTLAALQQLSQQQGTTLFMMLLSAFNVLLHRYSGQKDICIGSPIAGRQQQSLESLIGFFVNMLTLRSEMNGSMPFTSLLKQVKATTLEAYENQEVPFEKVVDSVVRERNMSRNPLFQVMFVLRNTPEVPLLKIGKMGLSAEGFEQSTALFEITLFLTETTNGLEGSIVYCTDLYTAETIGLMVSHFRELLTGIINEPDQKIGSLEMLSAPEITRLLVDFNDTFSAYPNDKSIVDLFEEQVTKTPAGIAVAFENAALTYRQLNERSNQLANYLKSEGVKEESLVPICIERGLDMLIGLLGILKCGAAFIPVDPEYPLERINYMLEETGSEIVVSSKESRLKVAARQGLAIIEIDDQEKLLNKQPIENPLIPVYPGQLAYVIFTSGSTGKPKGVMIQHGSVVNLLTSIIKDVDFKPASCFLSVTTFSFDICYLEFFVPLISGGKLVVVSREVAMDGYKLADSIASNSPTHMQGTPSTWQILLDSGWKNSDAIKMLIGGEAVKETIKEQLTKLGTVFNVYGPTETTIWSAIKKLSFSEKVVIGKPIAN
ncbi:MAG: condensation domain-containing protein, partial [Ferruginibacter sp.]